MFKRLLKPQCDDVSVADHPSDAYYYDDEYQSWEDVVLQSEKRDPSTRLVRWIRGGPVLKSKRRLRILTNRALMLRRRQQQEQDATRQKTTPILDASFDNDDACSPTNWQYIQDMSENIEICSIVGHATSEDDISMTTADILSRTTTVISHDGRSEIELT